MKKPKTIWEKDASTPIVLEHCCCCECYHPKGFVEDCRDDDNRYPTDNPKDKI
jgi:hypothetical protein